MQLPFVTEDKKHTATVTFLIDQFVDCVTPGTNLTIWCNFKILEMGTSSVTL